MIKTHLGKIYIKKRTFPEWLIRWVAVFPLLMAFFLEFLSLPGFLKYTVDVAWLLVLLSMVLRRRANLKDKNSPFILFTLFFFLYTLIVYCFNAQSPFYYLWGIRNNFRFYVAFIAFTMLFEEEDADHFLKMIDVLFWINALITFYQFFVLGFSQDYLGGIFGAEKGCNAYSFIFFSIVVGKSLLSFMSRKEKALVCFSKCAVAMIIAAMAELKIFFLVFVLLLLMAAVLTKFSWRKFAVLFLGAFLFSSASSLLVEIFGESTRFSYEKLVEWFTATSYASGTDLGRFTAIPTISRTILTEWTDRFFGMGLGNCDTSSFAICDTPFYQMHQNLHYTWFSSAFLYLETGYIGLMAYIGFFILIFFLARKHLVQGTGKELYCQMGMIMALVCILLTFYNSSLRMEVGYLAFFVLALPFIGSARGESEGE